MAVVFTQESEYAKEMRKWNAHHSEFGPPGRPYIYREYPKRLYKAARVDGQIRIADAQNADDEDQERNLKSRGFHNGPAEAFAACERDAHLIAGTLAAEREYAIQHGKHSEAAVKEIRAVEAAHGASHLPDVPATPIRRRGRPAKKAEMSHA